MKQPQKNEINMVVIIFHQVCRSVLEQNFTQKKLAVKLA